MARPYASGGSDARQSRHATFGHARMDPTAGGGAVRPARPERARRGAQRGAVPARAGAGPPGAVVRLITGRGRAGGGAPVRTRVRTLLRRLRDGGEVVRDYVLEEGEGSFLVRLTD